MGAWGEADAWRWGRRGCGGRAEACDSSWSQILRGSSRYGIAQEPRGQADGAGAGPRRVHRDAGGTPGRARGRQGCGAHLRPVDRRGGARPTRMEERRRPRGRACPCIVASGRRSRRRNARCPPRGIVYRWQALTHVPGQDTGRGGRPAGLTTIKAGNQWFACIRLPRGSATGSAALWLKCRHVFTSAQLYRVGPSPDVRRPVSHRWHPLSRDVDVETVHVCAPSPVTPKDHTHAGTHHHACHASPGTWRPRSCAVQAPAITTQQCLAVDSTSHLKQ